MGKLALIGCGVWGEKILADLLALNQSVVVVEPDANRRHEVESRFSVQCLGDHTHLPVVDGLVVATPASTHAAVLSGLVRLGKPIFVEKPLTTDLDSARFLAQKGGHLIFVMHIWHYHPGIRALAQIAREEILGAPIQLRTTRMNWTSPRKDVDSVWTLVPHDIAITRAILDRVPTPIFAHAETLNGRAVGMLAVLGDRQPRALLESSTRYRDKRREVRLHCKLGVAVLEADNADRILIDREGISPDGKSRQEFIPVDYQPPLHTELKKFVQYLVGGAPPPTNIEHGIEVVQTIALLRELAGLPN